MILPTVKLARRRNGQRETLKLNQTDYARRVNDLVAAGWKIVSMSSGDAPDDLVDFLRRQDEKEMARLRNPNHEASRDKERTWESKQGRPNIVTAPEAEAEAPTTLIVEDGSGVPGANSYATAADADATHDKPTLDPDWRKKRWFEKRAYVEAITGTKPTNARHADELMAQFE